MEVLSKVSLRPYNTFWMDMPAEKLLVIHSVKELAAVASDAALPRPLHILGGGSNVLLTAPVAGTVLLNRIGGLEDVREDQDHVWIRSGAGEVWHDLVLHAVDRGLGGIENLALIPGTVGASPIQNIGAYGAEVKDTITEVEAWDWDRSRVIIFSNEKCRFGYRDSIFKTALKGTVLITAVTFRLSKAPVLNTSYGAIEAELATSGAMNPSVRDVADAVIRIRKSKLPDPKIVGNAGSFFKNPTLDATVGEELLKSNPGMPYFRSGAAIKIPAGWLIESCGWKGYRRGDVGVHPLQALVLVNYGTTTGEEVWALSEEILQSVVTRFGITLEREVQVWG